MSGHRLAEIRLADVQVAVANPAVRLVNALPVEQFKIERIPGSISLPLGEVKARAREVLPDLEQEIIVYCGGPT